VHNKNNVFIKIKVQNKDFDVSKETQILNLDQTGAIVNFIGIVRGKDEERDLDINSMTLEHYPGMTEFEIENIINKCIEKWDISGVSVIHRVGKLLPKDQIVFVGVSSKHRQNAFDACNFIMDWLKTQAPFWKLEENSKNKKWVDFNSSDISAIKKWQNK
jgi:molybdopterin synthase catalytic subunit